MISAITSMFSTLPSTPSLKACTGMSSSTARLLGYEIGIHGQDVLDAAVS
jgi:hypothetical protein